MMFGGADKTGNDSNEVTNYSQPIKIIESHRDTNTQVQKLFDYDMIPERIDIITNILNDCLKTKIASTNFESEYSLDSTLRLKNVMFDIIENTDYEIGPQVMDSYGIS
jgi:hypothetical protein